MTTQLVDQIVATADSLATVWHGALDQVARIAGPNGEAFDFTKPLPPLAPPISLEQISSKVDAAIARVRRLSLIEDSSAVPDNLFTDVDTHVKTLKTTVEALKAAIDGFLADTKVTSVDPMNYSATNDKGASFIMSKFAVYANVQIILHTVGKLLSIAGASAPPSHDVQVTDLSSARNAVRHALSDASRIRKVSEATLAKLTPLVDEASQHLTTIRDDLAKATDARLQADAALVVVTRSQTVISDIVAKANALDAQVTAYAAKFQAFDAALATRDEEFQNGSGKLKKLLERLEATQKESDRIQQRAREVLGEATVSGLSERFAAEARGLQWRLWFAQGFFYLGIALLIFAAGVVLDVFPWLSQHEWVVMHPVAPPTDGSPWSAVVYVIGNLIGKAIVLLPPGILIAFSAKWYAALFRLREQYSYKYTVAASLPGFRVEAPEFYEAMTASAFRELLFNPAAEPQIAQSSSAADGASKDGVGNRWIDKLIDPFVKKALERAMDPAKPKT